MLAGDFLAGFALADCAASTLGVYRREALRGGDAWAETPVQDRLPRRSFCRGGSRGRLVRA